MNGRNVAPGAKAKPAPPVTAAWLERVALHYLDRYCATQEMLRRVLARRVAKRLRERDEEAGTQADLIEETVARAVRAGLVSDERFTAARLATLRRRGASSRKVGAALAAKGVERSIVDAALAAEKEDAGDSSVIEANAAQAYARRRRLGPHRSAESRATHRDRDLAAMARAGFSYPLAKAVIDAATDDAER